MVLSGASYGEVLRVLFRQLKAQTGAGWRRVPTVPAADLPGMTAFGRELALLKVAADGTRLDVADTAANRQAFGDPPPGWIGPGRYPQIRLLALIACGTRALIDAAWSTVSTGEPLLLDKLVYRGKFPPRDAGAGRPVLLRAPAGSPHRLHRGRPGRSSPGALVLHARNIIESHRERSPDVTGPVS